MNRAKRHGPLLILQTERAKDRDGRTSVHSGADGAPWTKILPCKLQNLVRAARRL